MKVGAINGPNCTMSFAHIIVCTTFPVSFLCTLVFITSQYCLFKFIVSPYSAEIYTESVNTVIRLDIADKDLEDEDDEVILTANIQTKIQR